MARAAKRQTQIEELKAEVKQLREAGQQLMRGLTEYAKAENWHRRQVEQDADKWIWAGEGDGPTLARKYLGLETETDRN
jgi:hypothetical protein